MRQEALPCSVDASNIIIGGAGSYLSSSNRIRASERRDDRSRAQTCHTWSLALPRKVSTSISQCSSGMLSENIALVMRSGSGEKIISVFRSLCCSLHSRHYPCP